MVSVQSERHVIAQEIATATPFSEAVAALAVIALSILGLIDVVPTVMLGVTTIVVGAGLLLQGTKMAAEYSRILDDETLAGRTQAIGGGITLEFLAGGSGIVLGILSLYSHAAQLAPAALIVFGGTLLLGGGVAARIGLPVSTTVGADSPGVDAVTMIIRQSASAAAGAQVLIGVAAVVLGILALAVAHAQTLNLVGLLAVGAGLLMTGVTSASAAVVNQAAP